jgi:hypothetical protein
MAQHGKAWQSMGSCGDALMRHLHELSTHRWILPVMGPWAHDISWQGRLALFIAGAPKFDTLRFGSDKGH